MTESNIVSISERLDQLVLELRRQGRAAVAAQAAAESCLAGIEALGGRLTGADKTETSTDETVLNALLPLFDALQRVAREAESCTMGATDTWWRFFNRREAQVIERQQALREGVRVLESSFLQAMDHLGVVVERRVGIEVDPQIHRVVEVRESAPTGGGERVVEVRRCGYKWNGMVLREADVVATR